MDISAHRNSDAKTRELEYQHSVSSNLKTAIILPYHSNPKSSTLIV